MATIGLAKLPIPAGGNSPTVPADLAALAEAIDPHLRHTVYDQAERDADFAYAPQHTLVTAADGSMWMKTDSETNTWAVIWEPLPSWRPVTLASGVEAQTTPCEIRREGTRVSMRGRVAKSSGAVFNDVDAPIKLGAVPSDCRPQVLASWAASCSIGGDTTDAAGRMEVLNIGTGSSNGVPGDILWWYQGTGGTSYIDLTGEWWTD